VRVLLSPALSSTTSPPFTSHYRSPGQTGHEESPAESYSQHTHIIPTLPLCTKHTHTHIYLYIHTYACIIIQSSSPPPRVTATSLAPRFLVLRYWHIASFLSPRLTGDQPFPPHPHYRRYNARRPIPGPRDCLARARAYTNGQCLQPGSPGHLFSAAFTHKIVNNPWARRRARPRRTSYVMAEARSSSVRARTWL